MARNRQNLNIIYISDRMRETLRPIASCALTAVVAPMGYGKTTAVRWFLAEQAKAGAVVLQASIYSDNRSIFWKSVQKVFAAAGLTVLEGYDCPADASGAALLLEDLCAALGGKTPYYLFLDDFHLLGDERVAQFLCRLAYRLPENVHLIVASRNRFLPGEQVVRLGRRLHRIEADGLRLNREELLAYTHRCGVEITAAQAESLLRSCEGWFSAVYLNLHALAERGSLLQLGSDIYAMFTAAFFPRYQALVMISLYLLGIMIGIVAALIMNQTAFRGKPVPFVMELPNYRLPSLKSVALLLWEKARDFLERAFTVIFLATIIIWFLQSFDTRLNVVTDSADSLLALIGQWIAPVFAPLGFADWRCATSLISGFIAKESVVSTLEILLGGAALSTLFASRAAISFLVFTLLYTPCIAAVATIRREFNSTLKTVGVVLMQCCVAWIVAFVVYTLVGIL